MTYTILSAAFANPSNTAAILMTLEAGAVLVSPTDRPELWTAMLAWGTPDDYVGPPSERRRVDKWLIIERVAAAGKGVEAKALLDMPGNEVAFFKWNAPIPSVYFDDADTVAMVLALGLDPEVVMAPG